MPVEEVFALSGRQMRTAYPVDVGSEEGRGIGSVHCRDAELDAGQAMLGVVPGRCCLGRLTPLFARFRF
jgi:hypothetical protein